VGGTHQTNLPEDQGRGPGLRGERRTETVEETVTGKKPSWVEGIHPAGWCSSCLHALRDRTGVTMIAQANPIGEKEEGGTDRSAGTVSSGGGFQCHHHEENPAYLEESINHHHHNERKQPEGRPQWNRWSARRDRGPV